MMGLKLIHASKSGHWLQTNFILSTFLWLVGWLVAVAVWMVTCILVLATLRKMYF